jgi:membrane protease YdiL (CAAX protease family)
MALSRWKTVLVLLLPAPLMLSMAAVFRVLTHWLGTDLGYVLGFLVYWVFWCLAIPAVVLGRDSFASLLRPARPLFHRANWAAAALWLLVTLVAIVMYLPAALDASYLLLAIAVPVASLNGFAEELLWRGLYLRTFPEAPIGAWIYPAIPFALWHLVPQMVFSAESGPYSLVVSTVFLGLAYGYITWRTKSVLWAALSHSLSGVIALGGAIAPSIDRLVAG